MKPVLYQPILSKNPFWILLLAISSLFTLNAFGQRTTNLTGRLQDTLLHKDCNLAVVVLMSEDSTLSQFTRSQSDGNFVFYKLPIGKYELLISHPTHETIHLRITILRTELMNLGTVYLFPKSALLSLVEVTQNALKPHLKKDTLEYNTSSLKMNMNASVEEMLRRLPGLKIDAEGTITFNGKKIEKLLVNGEDLFGSDPTLVTRNFDANKIAKVQIFDKKSDQAAFTGIDDGSRTKTLNLVMKENGKNGYFGKAEAGTDPNRIYNISGLIASFRQREQFTALTFISNTGDCGFSRNDGGSSSGIFSFNGNDDALGASAGKGIPQFSAFALHYVNAWNNASDHALGNYQCSHLLTQPLTSNFSIQNLPNSVYFQNLQSKSVNQQNQNWGYATFDYIPDSLSAFNFTFHGSNTTSQNQYRDTGFNEIGGVVANSSQRSINDAVSLQNIGGSAAWRIRVGNEASQAFSASFAWIDINSITKGYVYSLDKFYLSDGSLESLDTSDQEKLINNQSINLTGSLNYTKFLWERYFLGISYSPSYAGNKFTQATYNNENGKYQDFVDSLSNHILNHTLTHQVVLSLQGGGGRFNYTIGGHLLVYYYQQK
ncbi:MAG TPA: carboxypeptidase-like regulatory domain-containing protein, partial [Waddliaceae bacterium]